MKLVDTVELYGGGPGSGCRGPNCGRPPGTGVLPTSTSPPFGGGPGTGWVNKGPTGHVPNVVPIKPKEPKKPRQFKTDVRKVGGYFRQGTYAAKLYEELAAKPGEWHSIEGPGGLKEHHGGQAVITAIYTLKAAGIANGRFDIQREANRIRIVFPKPGEAPKALTDADEHFLLTAPVDEKNIKPLGEGGIHDAQLVPFTDGRMGVFKPDRGDDQDQIAAEVAAWKVAKIVGMQDLVPPAVVRTLKVGGRNEEGSLSLYKEGTVAKKAPQDKVFDGKQDLARAAAFDFMVGNSDRHMGNWVVAPSGKLVLIDHGYTFPQFRGDIWSTFTDQVKRMGADGALPKDFVEPYRSNWNKIVSVVKSAGFTDSHTRLDLMRDRLTFLSSATDWNKLKRHPAEGGKARV